MVEHSAGSSALGYLYQSRYALLIALKKLKVDVGAEISIEKFDDISFDRDGSPRELIQTKHHQIGTSKNLSDASVDLWKTIRVWCDGIEAGSYSPSEVNFIIATTSHAPFNSSASNLKIENRNFELALEKLMSTALSSQRKENKEAYEVFKSLSPEKRKEFISNFYVLDGSPGVEEVYEKIKDETFFVVPKEHHEHFLERLEGWWFNKIIKCLSKTGNTFIRVLEIDSKIDELREQFKEDNLPIDFLGELPPEPYYVDADTRCFVQQLKIISASNKRIEHAIKDYYRAFEQRARWVREDLLVGGELENYESKLIDEWERHFEKHKENLGENTTNDEKIAIGRNIYNDIQELSINIRSECNEGYVVRGSFQLLADKQLVGWHPEFIEILRRILASSGKPK